MAFQRSYHPRILSVMPRVKVEFIQFEDGSIWGDYETKKDVTERRAKNIAILTHLVVVT
jgi:hypothetical protein